MTISLTSLLAAMVIAQAPGTIPASDALARTGLVLEVQGHCPARDAIARALDSLLGQAAPTSTKTPRNDAGASGAVPPLSTRGTSARVNDRGTEFDLAAAAQVATYVDRKRDCHERARTAAVFIALALFPPEATIGQAPAATSSVPAATGPSPSSTVVAPARPPVGTETPTGSDPAARLEAGVISDNSTMRPPLDAWWLALSVGPRCEVAVGSGIPDAVACGGQIWAAAGRARYGVFASIGALAPVESRRQTIAIHEQRFPLAAGVTAQHRGASGWQAGLDLGLSTVPFTLSGEPLAPSTPARRLDVGARAALRLRFPPLVGSWTAALAMHADFFPRPYLVEVDPIGVIGASSRLWIGASAQIWYQLR